MILQAKMSEHYPCFYSSTLLMSSTGSIQAVLYAICFDREWNQWKLGWNIRLLSVFYLGSCGILVDHYFDVVVHSRVMPSICVRFQSIDAFGDCLVRLCGPSRKTAFGKQIGRSSDYNWAILSVLV
ncbi:WAT1-related protein [Melia azedarach]|uniref:WAT1-related protein n=1 Tax=Melia azedarach TaxID=155640 RepID=A0ACC1XV92_MELAZ|nr:WAT1-related protein [Melia azedarach]